MIIWIRQLCGWCPHRRLTWPISPRRQDVKRFGPKPRPYVVCLDCGQEYAYDWQQMKITKPRRVAAQQKGAIV